MHRSTSRRQQDASRDRLKPVERPWHPDAQVLACTLGAVETWEEDLFVIMNMQAKKLVMPLPRVAEGDWHLAVDTAGQSPLDVIRPADQAVQIDPACTVQAHSVVVFERR